MHLKVPEDWRKAALAWISSLEEAERLEEEERRVGEQPVRLRRLSAVKGIRKLWATISKD
jgi:hypothetical protein